MCTRVLYETGYGTYIVGRNADWNDKDVEIVMWLFPRGMKRDGTAGKNPQSLLTGSNNQLCGSQRGQHMAGAGAQAIARKCLRTVRCAGNGSGSA